MRSWILLFALLSAGCSITDEKVNEEIERRGGVVIESEDQIPLEGEPPFVVGDREITLRRPPRIEIAPQIPPPVCRDFCWETVSRIYLDGEPSLEPGDHEDNEALAELLSERAVDGYFPDVGVNPVSGTPANPPGQGPDGACDAGKRNQQEYFDAPNFPNSAFGFFERVYVLEQETCLRCLDPRTPAGQSLGCVRWYYARVKLDDGRTVIKVITSGTTESPSTNHRQALDQWNSP